MPQNFNQTLFLNEIVCPHNVTQRTAMLSFKTTQVHKEGGKVWFVCEDWPFLSLASEAYPVISDNQESVVSSAGH